MISQMTKEIVGDTSPQTLAYIRSITILIFAAKLLQGMAANPTAGSLEKTRDALTSFLIALVETDRDGTRLEAETLTLAKRMGIEVHQSYVGQSSGGVH